MQARPPSATAFPGLVTQASQVLDSPVLCKDTMAVGHVGTICAVLSSRYGRLESVAGMLLDAVNSHEHTPVAVAQALQIGAESYEDGQLVRRGRAWGFPRNACCVVRGSGLGPVTSAPGEQLALAPLGGPGMDWHVHGRF